MKALFDYEDDFEVINNGVNPLVEGVTTGQRSPHKEEKMKDFKTLYLIHQCVDVDDFEKVNNCTSS